MVMLFGCHTSGYHDPTSLAIVPFCFSKIFCDHFLFCSYISISSGGESIDLLVLYRSVSFLRNIFITKEVY